ncbi:MAG: HAMP domain-containing sensor histidine kinase [Pseudomonadales bacterium]
MDILAIAVICIASSTVISVLICRAFYQSRSATANLSDDDQVESIKQSAQQLILDQLPAAMFCVNKHGLILCSNELAKKVVPYIPKAPGKISFNHLITKVLDDYSDIDFEKLIARKRSMTHPNIGKLLKLGWLETKMTISVLDNRSGAVIALTNASAEFDLLAREKFFAQMTTIETLTTGIAHEINNPLMAVTTTCSTLAKRLDIDNPTVNEVLGAHHVSPDSFAAIINSLKLPSITGNIISATTRLSDLVANMLTFGRSSSIPKEPTDVCQLVNAAAAEFEHQHNIEIELIPCAHCLEPVVCNPIEIRQVVDNILGNARDAAVSMNIPHITITQSQADGYQILAISNNGKAIDPKVAEQVFAPFFTTKEAGSGYGLGLSLCFHIIENRHDGSIRIGLNDRGETEVTIELPIQSTDELPTSIAQ